MPSSNYRARPEGGITIELGDAGFATRLRLAVIAIVKAPMVLLGVFVSVLLGAMFGLGAAVLNATAKSGFDVAFGITVGLTTAGIALALYLGLLSVRTMADGAALSRLLPRRITFEEQSISIEPRSRTEPAYQTSWSYIVSAIRRGTELELLLSGSPPRFVQVPTGRLAPADQTQLVAWLERHGKLEGGSAETP